MTPSVMPRRVSPAVQTWPIYACAACFAIACTGVFAAIVVWRSER